jgi:hypothetical protein
LLLLIDRSTPSGSTFRLRAAVLLKAIGSTGPPVLGAMLAVIPE